MKRFYPRQESAELCPIFISNSATLNLTTRLSLFKARVPKQLPELILNGNLLGTKDSYGVTTNPGLSPEPLDIPLGVEALESVTEKSRKEANEAARAELLAPTPDLSILARYSGGGSLGESVNEYYTPQAVADAMWLAAGPLPKNARAFDPACGIGNLLARAPEGVKLTGVELSPVSSAIAQRLLPHASIVNLPFEGFHISCTDELYDVCMMNPPFGPRSMRHLDEKDEGRNEYYFLKKGVQRVKHASGILVALVNLNLAGEKAHADLRDFIQTYGQVIHTIAVPEGAFKKAGAKVSTVILTIRRHDIGVAEALSTLSFAERQVILGEYGDYNQRKWQVGEMVYAKVPLKKPTEERDWEYKLYDAYSASRRLGQERELTYGHFDQPSYPGAVDLSEYRGFEIQKSVKAALKEAPTITQTNILAAILKHFGPAAFDRACKAAREANVLPIPIGTMNPEKTWVMTREGWKPNADFAQIEIQDALQVATTLARAIKLHYAGEDASRLLTLTQKLHESYISKHGHYPKRLGTLAERYSTLGLLLAHLEENDLKLPAPRVSTVTYNGTPEEIALQLADRLQLTEETLCEHANVSQAEAEKLLLTHYCFNGELWIAPGLYYSGNAYLKSEHARTLAKQFSGVRAHALTKQAGEFLKRINPLTDVAGLKISPRDPIIPTAVLEAWVNFQLGSIRDEQHQLLVSREQGAVKFMPFTAQDSDKMRVLGSYKESEAQQLQNFLNHRTSLSRIEGSKDMSKEEYAAERAAAMEEASDYETRMTASFNSWLASSPYIQETLSAYNKARRAYLYPKGLTHPLPVKWAGPPPHPYQNADARVLAAQEGGVAGYGVGVGKTFLGLLLAGYLLELGLIQRPVIVAPAGLVSNWMTNAKLAYPHLNIIAIGMSQVFNGDGSPKQKKTLDGSLMFDERGNPVYEWKKDSPATRQQKLGLLAAGMPDITIMSREVYTSIPLSEETLEGLIATDEQYNSRVQSQDTYSGGKKGKHDILKRMEEFRAACLSKVKRATSTDLCFEALGVDATFLDESQAYKNLVSPPSQFGEQIKFIGGGQESNRALDANYKNRFIRERGGKTYTLSASWVKNSPLEIWTSLSLVTDILPELGLPTVEAMQEQYLKVEPRIVTNMEGEVMVKPAAVGFQKLRELKSVIDSRIIVRKPGDAEVILSNGTPMHVPSVVDIEYPIDMTPAQSALYADLRREAASAKGKTGEQHTFGVMWRMRKLTLDPVILLGQGQDNPRFEAIAEIALKERSENGKVLVFMSIGEKEGSFERLKETLIRRGYPAEEIEIVTSTTHKSSVERQDLEDRYNYGGLTCLLLSNVAEEGFNLQIGTSAIIQADVPWNFQSSNQRIGRGARQGNTRAEVRNYYLLMRGSFDSLTYTILKGKKAWEDQLGGEYDEVENTAAEFNADEIALLLAENPEAMREQIAKKKAELQERSGRAAMKRRMESLLTALNARHGVKFAITNANNRKKGWTAHDHVRVTNARRAYERAVKDVEREEDFPLGRLLYYTGYIRWDYGIPFHEGMTFEMEDHLYRIKQVDTNALHAWKLEKDKPEARGTLSILTYHQVARQGQNFQPTPDESQYDDTPVTEGIQAMRVTWPKNTPITVMNGTQVSPGTRAEGVLTLAIRDGKIESLSGATEENLRAQISLGKTLVHYLTEETSESILVQHVAVLCPNQAEYAKTMQVVNMPAFAERLSQIMKLAMAS